MKTLDDILSVLSGLRQVRGRRDRQVHAIRYDSRRVTPGDLFVAVADRDDHGPEFIPTAVEAGATVIVSDAPEHIPGGLSNDDVTLVVVDDARRAMAEMSHRMFDYPARRLKLYGVTGTNGKTTVSYVLHQLLDACGERTGVIGTLGKMVGALTPTGYTTPEAPELAEILDEMSKAGLSAVAMEVSSHALALQRVAGLSFGGVIFTNLTQDHLDFHRSFQEYHDAKKLLFDGLDADRPAVVNIDDLYGESVVRDSYASIVRYGSAGGADARIEEVHLGSQSTHWSLSLSDRLGGGTIGLHTDLIGAFNVSNITGAFALALALGLDRDRLVQAVAELRPVPGRMQSIALGNGATAVVDYAHTPDALENVLRTLRAIGGGGRLSVVFGCGGDRDRGKRQLMGAVAARFADHVILTSDNPRSESPESIIEEIAAGVAEGLVVQRVADRAEAICQALDASSSGDIVLVAGKGHEEYQIIGSQRRHFNDREEVQRWIEARPASQPEGIAAA